MPHNYFKKTFTNLSILGLLISASAAFAMPTANFETVVIEIPNTTLSSESIVPEGTPLKLVNLVTTHIDPGPSTVSQLGVTLTFPTNQLGLSTGSAVTYSVDGEIIATEVPEQRIIRLQTNLGRIAGVGFSIGENTYLLTKLNTPIEGVTSTIADSIAHPGTISRIGNIEYGLLPLNADPVSGQVFSESYLGSELRSVNTSSRLLYDADGLRGTTDSPTEEIVISDLQGAITNSPISVLSVAGETEVEAVVVFNDGSSSNVLGTRFTANFNYGRNTRTYLFDTETLIAYGKTIEDVAQVISVTQVDHDLSWAQLSFSGAERNNDSSASMNENKPPVANDDSYTVSINGSLNVAVNNGVLANDEDTTGDILTAHLISQTSNGILTFLNDGSFSYTPDLGFSEEDSFTYSVFDGEESSTAKVTIDVQSDTIPVHVEKIKASTKLLSQEQWRARARITVHDDNEKPAQNALVTFTLSRDGTRIGIRSCTTNTRGVCRVVTSRLSQNISDVVFTVVGISSENKGYYFDESESRNSNGTAITVFRP